MRDEHPERGVANVVFRNLPCVRARTAQYRAASSGVKLWEHEGFRGKGNAVSTPNPDWDGTMKEQAKEPFRWFCPKCGLAQGAPGWDKCPHEFHAAWRNGAMRQDVAAVLELRIRSALTDEVLRNLIETSAGSKQEFYECRCRWYHEECTARVWG